VHFVNAWWLKILHKYVSTRDISVFKQKTTRNKHDDLFLIETNYYK